MATRRRTEETPALKRTINWTHAFWVASGVPALVLFSIGAIAATIGIPSWFVWTLSIMFGFIQAFTYAEIAGLFPEKSGGASVYGAIAWIRYGKVLAPISVWTNWFAWSPVLAIGSGLAAGYLLNLALPTDSPILAWQVTLADLGAVKAGLLLRVNATFFIGAVLLLAVFALQHHGILRAARVQLVLGVASLVPLLIIGAVPLVTGQISWASFTPFSPLAFDAAKKAVAGPWDRHGWTLLAGGLFIAAWSTYAFETAVCYTREFKKPATDTFKAIFWSGVLCLAVFTIVPFAFQGALGLDGLLAPDIYSGMGVGAAMTRMIGGGVTAGVVLLVMLVLALLLAVMTSMAHSARTLYQASVDGWLPRYLGRVNRHGAPTAAMWTDLGFNLVLLMMSDYVFVLAMSNVSYMLFNFLNLNAGWIHRIDRPNTPRPYRAPNWLLGAGAALGFVNLALLGMGADVWGAGTLRAGLLFAAVILPVFWWRHWVTDRGVFPAAMRRDMHLDAGEKVKPRAGLLPLTCLAAGAAVVYVFYRLAA